MVAQANGQPMAYSQWARLLGFGSRQGADGWLERMKEEGYLRLVKSADAGTSALPTAKLKRALDSLESLGR